jgi:hypothetical protein
MTVLLTWISDALAMHCALELGLDDEALRLLATFPHSPDAKRSSVDPAELDGQRGAHYDARWGSWKGREEEFFRACAELVDEMSPGEVLAVAGARARLAAAAVKRGYQALVSEQIPPALRTGSFSTHLGADKVLLQGYSGMDPLSAPRLMLDILPYFDGGPLDETLDRIEQELGVRLESDLVRKLVDFEVLVPADARATPDQSA